VRGVDGGGVGMATLKCGKDDMAANIVNGEGKYVSDSNEPQKWVTY